MCIGGSPKPTPAPAQAAPVTAAAPEMATDTFDQQTASDAQAKKRSGRQALKINRTKNVAVNTNSTGSGLNIPK